MDVEVSVQKAYEFAPRFRKRASEGRTFPAVWLQADHADAGGRSGRSLRDLARFVRGAVVDHDDLERFIEFCRDGLHGLGDAPVEDPGFVGARDQDGEVDRAWPGSAQLALDAQGTLGFQ